MLYTCFEKEEFVVLYTNTWLTVINMKIERKGGVLLHISSLPGIYGIGDFGSEAYRFVDMLVENNFSVWQILPLGPLGPGNSPYQSYSAYAGNMLFISPDQLLNWKLLSESDLDSMPVFPDMYVDYTLVTQYKRKLLQKAWENFESKADENFHNEFHRFIDEHTWWLADYALYTICREYFGNKPWNQWSHDIASRHETALEMYKIKFANEIRYQMFVQFMFFRQWFALKNYAGQKGIDIFGDLPLYVSHDSSDVWGNQSLFLLDSSGKPNVVGGVPPDYFSAEGQLWGNPVYNWPELEKTNYQWWIARLYFNFHMYNLVRIDHFRGLESFWAIPAQSNTAKNGYWMPAYGHSMLAEMKKNMHNLPVIAEDLGTITPQVEDLKNAFDFPGMKVLQFAFESDQRNVHLPHNYTTNNVVYTGTHDNNTLCGWWNSISDDEKLMAKQYIPQNCAEPEHFFIEMAWASVAKLAIVSMQDILKADSTARMNTPGKPTGNWEWRFSEKLLKNADFGFMKMLNKKYNR